MLLTLAQNYEAFIAYVVLFGFCDGAWATVNNIQALTCVDQSRAASAYGFILLAASVTSMVGPPLSGGTTSKLPPPPPHFPWRSTFCNGLYGRLRLKGALFETGGV